LKNELVSQKDAERLQHIDSTYEQEETQNSKEDLSLFVDIKNKKESKWAKYLSDEEN
jgi:hypothetical protein